MQELARRARAELARLPAEDGPDSALDAVLGAFARAVHGIDDLAAISTQKLAADLARSKLEALEARVVDIAFGDGGVTVTHLVLRDLCSREPFSLFGGMLLTRCLRAA